MGWVVLLAALAAAAVASNPSIETRAGNIILNSPEITLQNPANTSDTLDVRATIAALLGTVARLQDTVDRLQATVANLQLNVRAILLSPWAAPPLTVNARVVANI
jgi:hypothetical protein